MPTAPTPTMPKLRRFTYTAKGPEGEPPEVVYGLSKDVVAEDGRPKIYVSRWGVDPAFRQIEKVLGIPEDSLSAPSLYETWYAAGKDPEIRESFFATPAEWQRILILPAGAKPETEEYILKDADRNQGVLEPSGRARSLDPVEVCAEGPEGGRRIVVARVHDIPFPLRDGRYSRKTWIR